MPSFSRPSVSDDNPYIESLFRTMKYCPEYHPDEVARCSAARRREYKPNPAHDPNSPHFNPKKTPEPADAAAVWQSGDVVEAELRVWYGRGEGGYYRCDGATEGNWVVHFNGTFTRDQLLQKSKSALEELDKL